MSEKPEFVKLVAPERKRIYRYGDGKTEVFENVVAVCARPTGTHRLETADGLKHVVPPGFKAVTLDVDEWTF